MQKTMNICVRYLVSGRVQGVFFRANARRQAESLDITGFARNLPNGCVEIVACGEAKVIEEFKAWLTRGPAGAEVSGVSSELLPAQTFPDFSIS